MKKINDKIKNERGSVTLYVLTTMMLFLSVILVIYMQAKSNYSNQSQQINKIKKEYEKGNIDEIYKEKDEVFNQQLIIKLYTQDGKVYDVEQWTNEDLKLKIIYPNDVRDDEKFYYIDGEKRKYTENQTISKNCIISAEYKDEKKEIKITKIDKNPAKVTFDKNGNEYILAEGEREKEVSTKIFADDGQESGISKIEYQISTSLNAPEVDSSEWKEIINEQTIKENRPGGIYYTYVKVIDVAGNIKIYRSNQFKVSYEIIYDANGGIGAPANQIKTHGTNLTLRTDKPTRDGYTFLGWGLNNKDKEVKYKAGENYTPNETIRLYAIWSKSIVATFNYYDGEAKTTTISGILYNDETSVEITTPSIENLNINGMTYVVRGWSTADTGNATINVNNGEKVVLNSNMTYYASYSYTVTATYYYYNGTAYTSTKPTATAYMNYLGTKVGAKPTTPTVRNPTGWTARGWSTSSSVTGTVATPGNITENEEYYYSWKKTVTLTYNANGGSGEPAAQTGTVYLDYKGSTTKANITISTTKPTRTGYSFDNWNSKNDGTGTIYNSGETISISNDTTIYAKWQINSYTVTYDCKTNGGTSATKTSAIVKYNALIDLTPTATKSGYTFVGWNTDKNATTKLDSLKMGTSNVTLYAIYSKTITATFNYYNGQKTTVTGTMYNTATTVSIKAPTLANATKDSITYTQRGWSTSNAANATINVKSAASVTLSANATYYASYSKSIVATFYYYNGSAQTSTTASGMRYMNYVGSYVQGSITIPTVVTESVGEYATKYTGLAKAVNSVTNVTATTANTKYYAYYTVAITYYYYNGTEHTSSAATRRYYSNGTNYLCSVSDTPIPTAYDGSTFKWWSYDANHAESTYKRSPNATTATKLYAVYQKTVTATFYYHGGTDEFVSTQSSTTANGTRSYVSKSGGINKFDGNIAIPSVVTGSTGYYGTDYKGVSKSKNSSTAATPTTDTTSYYAFYNVEITYYYYNGTAHTSSTTTRRAVSDGSKYVCTVDSTPTPTAYNGSTFKWWSYDANHAESAYKRVPNATGVTKLYAVYQKTITATFYYHGGTDEFVSTQSSATASGTRSYVSKSAGINTFDVNIAVPSAVTESTGYYGTDYKGISKSKNSSTAATPTTAATAYYAFYNVEITYYYYNGTAHTSSTTTRRAVSDGSKYVCTVDSTPTPTAYDGSTFKWWSYDANHAESAYKRAPNATAVTKLYAVYQRTITAKFYYYNGSTATSVNGSGTRSYVSKAGGINTFNVNITIPEAVKESSGAESTKYSHVSTSKTGSTTTPTTSVTTYYAVYKKTVTATLYTYNNVKTTKTGTAYGYYDGTTANASINLGTATPPTGYTVRGWSTKNTANATINVKINNAASIINNTTYYMSYLYTVTATYYYYNGTSYTSTKPTATAYMNYLGTKVGAKPTTPTVSNPTGWTARGWSTSSSVTGTVATPGNITVNEEYYYSWKKTVTLTYNANGGSGVPSAQTGTAYLNYKGSTTQASISISATKPNRSNYIFQNWNTKNNGTGTTYNSSGTIKISSNTTIYAIWKANPTVSITKQPTALTVVAGNKGSFSVTATGGGTIKYQWYYNTTGDNTTGTAVSGATGATYPFTSSTGMSGRYYYCVVTSTVDTTKETAKSSAVKLTVLAANYSTLKSGTTTYYNTLETAIAGATSGGGDTGGGTITVLNTLTDISEANTNKTITINTNGKTLTRNQSIITTGGTLTIRGEGTIYCNASEVVAIKGNGGNITVLDKPMVRSFSHAIYTTLNSSGDININGGYFYTTQRSTLGVYGNGDVLINSAFLFTPVRDKAALLMGEGSTGNVAIQGNSRLGNGSTNSVGAESDNGHAGAIMYYSTGSLTINNSLITAGPYAASGINVYKPTTINCLGATSIYSTNESGNNCLYVPSSGVTITFNSTGYFYCTAGYVVNADKYSINYNIKKGNFVSRKNKYMFTNNGGNVEEYVSTSALSNRTFIYMTNYDTTTKINISNCYYLGIGV